MQKIHTATVNIKNLQLVANITKARSAIKKKIGPNVELHCVSSLSLSQCQFLCKNSNLEFEQGRNVTTIREKLQATMDTEVKTMYFILLRIKS